MKNEVAILPDKNGVEDKGMVVILGQRDDEATVGELQAATARHLDRRTDEMCGKCAIGGEDSNVELQNVSVFFHSLLYH